MADWDALAKESGLVEATPRRRLGELLGTDVAAPVEERDSDKAKYDPTVGTGRYVGNELLKLPGGILGLAPDALDWALKKAFGQPADFGNITRKLQTGMGAEPALKPPGPGSERLGTMATNIAASIPFAGAALRTRGALGVATEMLAGTAGGVGQVVGEEAGPLTGIIGNILGSAAGYRTGNVLEKTIPVVTQIAKAVGSEADRHAAALKARGVIEGTPEFQAAMAKAMETAKAETIGSLRKAYAQEDIKAVERAFDEYKGIQQTFPGVRSSVGEITANDAALALQGKLESKNIPNLEERGARVRATQAALLGARERLVPEAVGGVKSVIRGVRTSLDDELRGLEQQASGYETDLAAATTRAEGAARPVAEVGTDIKGASSEGYKASKGVADKKYQAFRAAVGDDAPAEVPNVTKKLTELRDRFVFDKEPEVLSKIPGVSGAGTKEVPREGPFAFGVENVEVPGTMTVAQLDDLSSAANRDIQRLKSASNPDRKAIAQLTAIRAEAQNSIRTILGERGNTEALSRYAEANRYFGQEHAPKYLTGVNLELRLKNAINEERIKPERVVQSYYKPNGTTEALRFNEQFANNGAAKEALARGVFDLYKREVIDVGGGVINPNRHDVFMRKYAAANEQYPWIASRLEKNQVAGEIASRMKEKRALMGDIAESKLSQVVGTKDSEAFMLHALSNKRQLFEAMGRMKPEDRQNFAIAVLNRGWDEAGKGSKQINEFLSNNDNLRLLFRQAFGKEKADEHMGNLQKLARGLQINEAAPKTSPMTALSENEFKKATGTSPLQIFAALRAMGRGQGSVPYFASVFGGQMARAKLAEQSDAVMKQQIFDPDLLMATIRSAQLPEGMKSGYAASGRGREMISKLWDLTKAAVGQGAPEAAAKRLPAAMATAEE